MEIGKKLLSEGFQSKVFTYHLEPGPAGTANPGGASFSAHIVMVKQTVLKNDEEIEGGKATIDISGYGEFSIDSTPNQYLLHIDNLKIDMN